MNPNFISIHPNGPRLSVRNRSTGRFFGVSPPPRRKFRRSFSRTHAQHPLSGRFSFNLISFAVGKPCPSSPRDAKWTVIQSGSSGGGEPTTRWPPAAVASHYKFKWMVIAHLELRKGARSGAAKKKRRTKDHQPDAGAFRTWDKWGISGGDYGQSDSRWFGLGGKWG